MTALLSILTLEFKVEVKVVAATLGFSMQHPAVHH